MTEVSVRSGVGPLLRDWRRRRRRSQMDLALDAGVSARHVSFVESGRSRPSAEMVVRLAEQLEVPLRDSNQLLLASSDDGLSWSDFPTIPGNSVAGPTICGTTPTLCVAYETLWP